MCGAKIDLELFLNGFKNSRSRDFYDTVSVMTDDAKFHQDLVVENSNQICEYKSPTPAEDGKGHASITGCAVAQHRAALL